MKRQVTNMKTFAKILSLILCASLIFAFAACSSKPDNTPSESQSQSSEITHPKIKVTVKDFGEFTLELYPEYAPTTVENFVKLVRAGFYTGSKFHRVVEGFMAQGGQSANGETAETIKGEFKSNGFDKNTLSHERGVISMARATDKDSASSQFFICYDSAKCKTLDGDYAAFGKVIDGMETVDKFTGVEMTYNSIGEKAVPVQDIVIESMEVIG